MADSLDDAGYLYHDLTRLCGEDAVVMFPSGYKRDIKYGQADPPSQILRTEALTRWESANPPRFMVTYPEAMAEKVAPRRACAAPSSIFSATATSFPTAWISSATT